MTSAQAVVLGSKEDAMSTNVRFTECDKCRGPIHFNERYGMTLNGSPLCCDCTDDTPCIEAGLLPPDSGTPIVGRYTIRFRIAKFRGCHNVPVSLYQLGPLPKETYVAAGLTCALDRYYTAMFVNPAGVVENTFDGGEVAQIVNYLLRWSFRCRGFV